MICLSIYLLIAFLVFLGTLLLAENRGDTLGAILFGIFWPFSFVILMRNRT